MRHGQLRAHAGRVRLGRISRSALLVSHDSLRVVLYVRVQLSRPHVGDSERSGAEAGLVPWYAYARSLTHSLAHSNLVHVAPLCLWHLFVADPFLSCVARSGASGHVQLHGFLGTLGTALGGAGVEEAGAVVGE